MQMTCEWLECIRMIGEVYILTSTWDLGLGDREDRQNQSNISRGSHQHLLCRGLASS